MEVFGFGGLADSEYSVSVQTNYLAEYSAETGIRSTTTRNPSMTYMYLTMHPRLTLNLSMKSINHLEPENVNILLKICFKSRQADPALV
jgi:hypothetical protein